MTGDRDRAVGAFVGLAVGDALGVPLEFRERDVLPRVTGMIGGGAFGLEPGQWTDDTSMALCLAESVLETGAVEPLDLMRRFVDWLRHGANSVTGECFDIGNTTRAALESFERTDDPLSGSALDSAAGNGSLMRLAPVAVRWWREPARAVEAARIQSRTTHGAAQAVEACAFCAALLAEAIPGAPAEEVLRPRAWRGDPAIAAIAGGGWRGRDRDRISSSGYVVDTLEAALWSVGGAGSFEEALVTAVNLADDADTVGAVTGQLAGALWGLSGIPERWLAPLAWRERIERLAADLFDAGAGG